MRPASMGCQLTRSGSQLLADHRHPSCVSACAVEDVVVWAHVLHFLRDAGFSEYYDLVLLAMALFPVYELLMRKSTSIPDHDVDPLRWWLFLSMLRLDSSTFGLEHMLGLACLFLAELAGLKNPASVHCLPHLNGSTASALKACFAYFLRWGAQYS